jgi:hypothetical protein
MQTEANMMLKALSFISQNGSEIDNREVNKWLDKLRWLEELERELKKSN